MCTRSTKLKYVRCVLGCVLHHQMNRKSSQQRASLPLQQKSDYNSKINCRKRFQSKLNCGLKRRCLQIALVHHCPRTQNTKWVREEFLCTPSKLCQKVQSNTRSTPFRTGNSNTALFSSKTVIQMNCCLFML